MKLYEVVTHINHISEVLFDNKIVSQAAQIVLWFFSLMAMPLLVIFVCGGPFKAEQVV